MQTEMLGRKCTVRKIITAADPASVFEKELYKTEPLSIENYLWIQNGYTPVVKIYTAYSVDYIFVGFKVFEQEVTAKYTEVNSPVYKDSCVEFFINLFPHGTVEYFNFEINAIGTLYAAFGEKGKRELLTPEDIELIKIDSMLTVPLTGKIPSDYWEVKIAVPFKLFEKYYKLKFEGEDASVNFYKCGDETKYLHFGAWSEVVSKKPDFHQPGYFGTMVFGK